MSNDAGTNPSGFRDLAQVREWAMDEATHENMFRRLYQQWPAVHPQLAANPRTPADLLSRLANSSDPAIMTALASNPAASGLNIRPRTTWEPPTTVAPQPAPLGMSNRLACPHCHAIVQAHQVRCFSCNGVLPGPLTNITGVIPVTAGPARHSVATPPTTAAASGDAVAAGAPAAEPAAPSREAIAAVQAVAAAAPAGAPGVVYQVTAVQPVPPPAPKPAPGPTPAVKRAAAEVKKIKPRRYDAAVVSSREYFDRVRGKVGAGSLIGFFALLFFLALSLLVGRSLHMFGGSEVSSATKAQPRVPSATAALPVPKPTVTTVVVGVSAAGQGATTAASNPKTPTESFASTSLAPGNAAAPVTSPRTTTKSATTVKATTSTAVSLAPKSETTATPGAEAAVTTLAQEYASALASENLKLVAALNPTHTGDLSGYRDLQASTVFPVSMTLVNGEYSTKLGLVAHQLVGSTKRTVLYCAVWRLNLANHTVVPTSAGRQISVASGYVDPASFLASIVKNCK